MLLLPRRDAAPSDAMGHCVMVWLLGFCEWAMVWDVYVCCRGEVLCVVWPGMEKRVYTHTLGKAMHNEYYAKRTPSTFFHPHSHTYIQTYMYGMF